MYNIYTYICITLSLTTISPVEFSALILLRKDIKNQKIIKAI